MKFGITIKPDISVERIVALTRQAEAPGSSTAGFLTPTCCGRSRTRC